MSHSKMDDRVDGSVSARTHGNEDKYEFWGIWYDLTSVWYEFAGDWYEFRGFWYEFGRVWYEWALERRLGPRIRGDDKRSALQEYSVSGRIMVR